MADYKCSKESEIAVMEIAIHSRDTEITSMSRAIHSVKKVLIGDPDVPDQPGLLEQYRAMAKQMTEVLQKFSDTKENNKWFWREILSGAVGAAGSIVVALVLLKMGLKF
jgi:hypothetical protein